MEWILENWIEVFGYIGSVIVVLSLMMSNILYLRWINLLGAAIFSTYGLLITAIPVCIVNGLIVVIDIYYLVGIYRARELFSLMEVEVDNELLQKFLTFFEKDIHKYFPDFKLPTDDKVSFVMVFRDIIPAGVFAYQKADSNTAKVLLDYISPNYRDYKNADYLISTRKEKFLNEGIQRLETTSPIPAHQKYLQKIGFLPQSDHPHHYIKTLKA